MNHMQMPPKAQAQLGGGGQGVQPWQKQRPRLSGPPSPARSWQSRAGRDRADFKPEQWAGTIYKLSRKTHIHTHTKPQPLSLPHTSQISRLMNITPFSPFSRGPSLLPAMLVHVYLLLTRLRAAESWQGQPHFERDHPRQGRGGPAG